MDEVQSLKADSDSLQDALMDGQRTVLPWRDCKAENREWQEEQVRQQGYCPYCENLDLAILSREQGSSNFRGWPEPCLDAVRRSAEAGCKCCDLFCRIVDDFSWTDEFDIYDSDTDEHMSANASDISIVDFYFGENDSEDLIFYLRQERRPASLEDRDVVEGIQRIQISRLRKDTYSTEKHLRETLHPYGKSLGSWTAIPLRESKVPDNVGDSACLSQVEHWLQECVELHESHSVELPELPSRVIQIVSDKVVRLVESNGHKDKYLTLSHHWGRSPLLQPKRTTLGNLNQHKIGIAVGSLNQTLRDAIRLTHRLGFEFIWIDSLCIIQDDPQNWAQESGKMSDIFGNSTMTIFSATPAGCFVRRQTLQRIEDRLHARDFDTKEYRYSSDRGEDITVIAHPVVTHSRVAASWDINIANSTVRDEAYIFNRGWVLQEWLLTPRAIVFDRDELFWCCKHAELCECKSHVLGRSLQDTPLALRQWLQDGNPWAPETPENDRWLAIAESYSRTELTFETDRLAALSGLAKAYLSQTMGKDSDISLHTYLAGCWEHQILQSLLWRPDIAFPRTGVDTLQSPNPGYIAPSWSWLSAHCSITFPALDQVEATYFHLARVDEAYCQPATSDRTGSVKSGFLKLYAPTLDYDLDLISEERWNPLLPVAQRVYRDFNSDIYTRVSRSGLSKVKAKLVLISCSTHRGTKFCERGIIVVPCAYGSKSFERIGSFTADARSRQSSQMPLGKEAAPDLPEHLQSEYINVMIGEERAWSVAAFGMVDLDSVDAARLRQFTERLRSGTCDERLLTTTLLPKCSMEMVTIV